MWPYSLKLGLGGGVVAILLALIGMVESFHQRHIISEIASMGQTLLACTALFFSYLAARKTTGNRFYKSLSNGIICGLLFGISLALLVKISTILNLRAVFINASPLLFKILTFSQGTEKGGAILIISSSCLGLLGGCFFLAPPLWRRVFSVSLGSVILIGVLQDLLRPTFALWGPLAILNDWLYTANGLTRTGAAAIFILAALLAYIWMG